MMQTALYPSISRATLVAALLLGTTAGCMAQEMGRVLSSTPVMQSVGVPRQVCTVEQVAVQPAKSGAGAALGAIAGGAIGNAVGAGAGRAAATVVGVIGGAMVGDRVEGEPSVQVQNVQRCSQQTFFENRAVAFNVVYEYAGRQYTVQMPSDPGPTLPLQVSPLGANAAAQQPAYAQAPVVVMAPPVYPVYYERSYYPPVRFEWGVGRWGAHHGHGGHGHWR